MSHRPEQDDGPVPRPDVEMVYRAHAELVSRWVAHLAGPALHGDAEDLVHEIFLVVQRQLPGFRGESQLTTWLFRITQNVVSTARRKERTRRWMRLFRRTEMRDALACSASMPGDALAQQEDVRTLHQALEKLPEKYRSLLILFEIEAMTGDEIATLTGLLPQTVRVRLHRGRKLFLAALGQLGVTGHG